MVLLSRKEMDRLANLWEIHRFEANAFRNELLKASNKAFDKYEWAMSLGVAKEQARFFLPINIYSQMYWSCNARSLMHFLSLRNSEKAQFEIREYAIELEKIFAEKMPITYRYFVENGRIAP